MLKSNPAHGYAAVMLLLVGGCAVLVSAGCDPPLDPEKYGEIVTTLPVVEGADKPYPLPQLEESAAKGQPDQK
jgi:hypothetical protein